MAAVETKIKGLEKAKKNLSEARKKLTRSKVPYRQSAVFLDRWVQENFKTEGSKVGGWKPFKRGGRFAKRKGLDTAAKLLQDSGLLRASFKPWATNRNAGIGSKLPYSEPHNEGTNGLPQRRMIPLRSEIAKDIRKIFSNYARKELAKLFGR